MKTRIPTVDPATEPEYVGAHSALSAEQGQSYAGEVPEQCGSKATHTIVMIASNGLHEIAMCDDCGEPDDVEDFGREWSHERG